MLNKPSRSMKPISTRVILLLPAISSLFFFSGCKDEDVKPRIEAGFAASSGDVAEGDTLVVELNLEEPPKSTEYITLSVTSSNAVFGVDYGIGNLLEFTEPFTIKVSPNATTVSFTVIALEDFESETVENVRIEISEVSSGLVTGQASFTANINHVPNYETGNRAIVFDGVDDYIDLGNIYDDLALPLTISAWIWLDPSAPDNTVMPIFDSQDGLPVYNGVNFLTSKTSVAGVQYGDGQGENNIAFRRAKSATFGPVAGRWVNFTAVVKAAMDMNIYFNGVDVGGDYMGDSNLPMNSNSSTEVAKIGALTQNGIAYKFKGKIDEVKVWNRALTTPEIQKTIFVKSPATEPGLIGYWDFDEPTGQTVLDHSANQFDGLIKGNAARVLSEAPVR